MKVLLLTDGITPYVVGGMQKHSFMLAKYLARSGVYVELHHCVFTETIPDALLQFEDNEKPFVKVIGHFFPKSIPFPGHYVYRSYKYSELLYKVLKGRISDFDFIYAKGFTAWKLIKEKSIGLKCPPIGVKFHGYEMYQRAPSFKVKLEHYLLRPFVKWNTTNADKVFSYGGKITSIIKKLGVDKNQIIEIPSGIEESFIRNLQELKINSPVSFCFVGRFERRKGVEELSQALKVLIKKRDLNFQFHFIGPIPEVNQILDERIVYHGQVDNIKIKKNIMDQCDVLVCPSYSEGMPNVILEGMARGLAIIATDVGANSLMVQANSLLLQRAIPEQITNELKKYLEIGKLELMFLKKKSILTLALFKWSVVIERFKSEIERAIK